MAATVRKVAAGGVEDCRLVGRESSGVSGLDKDCGEGYGKEKRHRGALPVLLIFTVGGTAAGDALNSEAVAAQIIGTLVGSIGLIAAVPITTAIAAMLASRLPCRRGRRDASGSRSLALKLHTGRYSIATELKRVRGRRQRRPRRLRPPRERSSRA